MINKLIKNLPSSASPAGEFKKLNNSLISFHNRILYRDISIITAICAAGFLLSCRFDIFEWILYLSRKYEILQLDEILIVLGILSISLTVFSFRRWDTLKKEVTIRAHIENKLIESLQEKEILLREVHHRVKNNFQIISSLLDLQKHNYREPELIQLFNVCENRIRTMALIHERLYNSDNLSQIDFAEFIRAMASEISSSGFSRHDVRMDIQAETLAIGINQAIPCGLIVNELVTNSLKHAFSVPRNDDRITIVLEKKNDEVQLVIGDNGSGLSADFNPEKADTLGLKLVSGLVRQIRGTLDIKNGNGTEFHIHFHIPAPESGNSRV